MQSHQALPLSSSAPLSSAQGGEGRAALAGPEEGREGRLPLCLPRGGGGGGKLLCQQQLLANVAHLSHSPLTVTTSEQGILQFSSTMNVSKQEE